MKQMVSFINVVSKLSSIKEILEYHHGDCIGADEQSHELINMYCSCADVFIHPPLDQSKQAFCAGQYRFKPKNYIQRNHDIVDTVDVLIGAPKEFTEVLRSGTWATIRYAGKKRMPVIIIWPDGNCKYVMQNVLGNGKSLPNGTRPNLVDLSGM